MKKFAGGPKILVSVGLEKGKVAYVQLSLFDSFCLEIPEPNDAIWQWLSLYAKKKQPKQIALELDKRPFTTQILSKMKEIPFGSTTTYQALAEEVGNPKAARAVGNACGSNPFPLFIPCHRVLHADGSIGGFSCGIEIKRRLLEFERS